MADFLPSDCQFDVTLVGDVMVDVNCQGVASEACLQTPAGIVPVTVIKLLSTVDGSQKGVSICSLDGSITYSVPADGTIVDCPEASGVPPIVSERCVIRAKTAAELALDDPNCPASPNINVAMVQLVSSWDETTGEYSAPVAYKVETDGTIAPYVLQAGESISHCISDQCCDDQDVNTHALDFGTGDIPAGLKSVVITNLTGTNVINGGFTLSDNGVFPRSISLGASELDLVTAVLPAMTVAGGTWQWHGIYPVQEF